jgi:ABC-type Fe3+ transport system permease subunit
MRKARTEKKSRCRSQTEVRVDILATGGVRNSEFLFIILFYLFILFPYFGIFYDSSLLFLYQSVNWRFSTLNKDKPINESDSIG